MPESVPVLYYRTVVRLLREREWVGGSDNDDDDNNKLMQYRIRY